MNVTCRAFKEVDIRLVDGFNPESGRLEIYHNEKWGAVCDEMFSYNEAQVVCRQFGYPSYEIRRGGYFGHGTGMWLDWITCDGDETGLSSCSHSEWGNVTCSDFQDVGVECKDREPPMEVKEKTTDSNALLIATMCTLCCTIVISVVIIIVVKRSKPREQRSVQASTETSCEESRQVDIGADNLEGRLPPVHYSKSRTQAGQGCDGPPSYASVIGHPDAYPSAQPIAGRLP
jgi:hypothetical protein